VTNYLKTFRNLFYFILAIQVSLILFGFLRPSIFYDYLDNWPFSLFPIILLILNKIYLQNFKLNNYIYGFLIFVYTLFPIILLTNFEILTTNTYNSGFQNKNFEKNIVYNLNVNLDGSLIINTFDGSGYIIDIQNKPGNIGFPEVIESSLGDPRPLYFRELDTNRLFQVSGWDLQLGNKTIWSLNIISFQSLIKLDDLNLLSSEIVGTGDIFLGENLNSGDIFVSGNFNIFVNPKLPIVVVGQAEVPAGWINATIGYLNQTNENYKFKVIVEEGSQIRFIDED